MVKRFNKDIFDQLGDIDMEKLDRGMESLDRGMESLDRVMSKLDKKLESKVNNISLSGRQMGRRGKSIVTDGNKIIINGRDFTDTLKHDYERPIENRMLMYMGYGFKAIIFIAIIVVAITAGSMVADLLNDTKYKPKTLDTKPPIVETVPNTPKAPGVPEKRL